ncbi:MAG: class I SAM-dependent methyltransferase [Gemmatimonadota bacterium]
MSQAMARRREAAAAGLPGDEYAGVQARFYDQYFTGLEGDVEFYRDEALSEGGPVLELGCGSGRTLLPIATAGIDIVGLESSADMLARGRRRLAALPRQVRDRVELVEGDMRDFSLGRTFTLITIPYRTFQHLLEPEDQRRALAAMAAHLEPGGRLVYNTFDPARDLAERAWSPTGPLELDTEFQDPETGRQVRVCFRRAYDLERQHLLQELQYEESEGERVVATTRAHLTLRYTYRFEMEHLLAVSGFQPIALYGYFDGRPYPGFGEQVWVAERQ